MAYEQYPSRTGRRNYFPVRNQVLDLRLHWKQFAVYLYLIFCDQCQIAPSEDAAEQVANVFAISRATAKKILDSLFAEGLLSTVSIRIFTVDRIPEYEEPENFFPLPKELFSLGLSLGEVALYAYLMFREIRKTYSCIVARSEIHYAMYMSGHTVAKYTRCLEEKKFILTEHTGLVGRDGRGFNGKLRFRILPVEGAKRKLLELQLEQVRKLG